MNVDRRRTDVDNNEDTQNTGSSQPLSDLSIIENDTDDFGRRIVEHERRDRERLRNATADNGTQAFSKARTRPRIALTMDNLERNNASRRHDSDEPDSDAGAAARRTMSESAAVQMRRHSTMSVDEGSSPSHNVPSQWGRKGRQRNDFLRRISAQSLYVEIKQEGEEKADPDRIYKRRTVFTGDSPRSDVDWMREEALNKLEGGTTQSDGQAERGRNTSIEEILRLEKEELPGDSSPTSRMSARRALSGPSFSKEEVADLEGRGLTTSRLSAFGSGLTRRRQRISQVPNGNLSQDDHLSDGKDHASVVASKSVKAAFPRRQMHGPTNGPRAGELLRELAGSSSTTSPPNGARDKLPATRDTFASLNKKVNGRQDLDAEHRSSSRRNKRGTSPDGRNSRGPSRVDSALARTTPTEDDEEDDPQGRTIDQDVEGENTSDHVTDETYAPSQAPPSTTSHPHSAAEALLQDPEANALGDSTIHSLQDLLDANPDVDFSTVLPLDGDTFGTVPIVGVPLRAAPPPSERQEEVIALQRMNERLKAARTGLRDASRGLKRVEHRVDEAEVEVESTTKPTKSKTAAPTTSHVCTHEDITLGKLVARAWRDFMENFYAWPRNGRLRMTWLGLLCLILLAWWLSENTLCEYYCHPLYATSMRGYGVDIYAPRKPYVTFTVLIKRPLSRLWRFLSWMIWGIDDIPADRQFGNGFTAQQHTWRPPADMAFGEDEYI